MNKIKKNNDFQLIYKQGKKIFGYYQLIYYKKNNLGYNRYGFVVSKKNGNAVCRNRIKRLFKEFIRKNETKIKESYDIIIISKRTAGEKWKKLKYQDIHKDLNKILKNKELIK